MITTTTFLNGTTELFNTANNASLTLTPGKLTPILDADMVARFCGDWKNMYFKYAVIIMAFFIAEKAIHEYGRRHPLKTWPITINYHLENIREALTIFLMVGIILVWVYTP